MQSNNTLKAISYEVLCEYLKDDKRAFDEFKKIENEDLDYFVSFSSRYTKNEEEKLRFEEIWRKTRDSFSKMKIDYDVLEKGSEDFPSVGDDINFLYTAGNKELLKEKKLVVFGDKNPSMQAKEDSKRILSEAVFYGYTILSPLECGLDNFILEEVLKIGGNTIAILSDSLNRCSSIEEEEVMENLYKSGLLVTQFAPSRKREVWYSVLRNRLLSSLGDAFFIIEEKDGGPGWKIVDEALEKGKKVMALSSVIENPNFRWFKKKIESGLLVYKKKTDLKSLFLTETIKKEKKKKESPPSLFD